MKEGGGGVMGMTGQIWFYVVFFYLYNIIYTIGRDGGRETLLQVRNTDAKTVN